MLYRLHSAGDLIGNSPAGTRRVLLSAVAKQNNPQGAAYCLANEFICGELARFLRLPAPPVAFVAGEDGVPRVATLDFNLSGQPLVPADVAALAYYLPSLATGIALFDIWVANPDRHNGNLALNLSASPPRLAVFDHGQALLGHIAGDAIPRLSRLRDALGTGCCVLPRLREETHFPLWLARIRATPDYFIEELCTEAHALGLTGEEAAAAADFLRYRRDALPEIVMNHPGLTHISVRGR